MPLGRPVITTQPAGAALALGASLTLTVAATAAPAPAYQWFRNGTPLPAATTATLAITPVAASDAGTHTATVSNLLGNTTSDGAIITVSVVPSSAPSDGGGSGGGAPSLWFLTAFLVLAVTRRFV